MAAPPKPWETAGVVSRQSVGPGSSFVDQMSGSLPVSAMPRPTNVPDTPARPTRPQRSNYSTGFNSLGYGGGLGSYGGFGNYGNSFSNYGGFGGYGPMGGGSIYGGYGMNRLGYNEDYTTNSFAQQAELSSRHAFQSIESVVQVFSSIAMMLESTFQAVYSSFRAVIGVADHFSRMKVQLARIFSALAVVRTLRLLVRKLLVLLRLRGAGAEDELWTQAVEASSSLPSPDGFMNDKPRSSWPVMVFFALVIGGPWLIWKFLNSLSWGRGVNGWASGLDDHYVARAEYDFEGENNDELSFKQGTEIILAPKELQPRIRGWLLGSVDGKTTGIVPQNYIKILGRRPGQKTAAQASLPTAPLQNTSQRTELQNSMTTTEMASIGPKAVSFAAVPSLDITDLEREFGSEEPQLG